MPKPPQDPFLTEKAREMRQGPTSPERRLWKALRGRAVYGLRWRRQHPHRNSILDFYCPTLDLAIELDGDGPPESKAKEAERRKMLEAGGIRVLAFGSVILAGEDFWEILQKEIEKRAEEKNIELPTPPGTLSYGRGQGEGDLRETTV